ncbi:MAG: hypothetical protein WBI63_05365 [Coriobacteriia bacterium]
MGFFVVGRSTAGLLEMFGSEEYETREDAARGIQTLAMAGAIDVSGRDVYIVDMAGATPVVIVVAATPAPGPVEEAKDQPAAGAWETTGEVMEVLDAVPDEVAAEEGLPEAPVVDSEAPSEGDKALEDVAGALDDEATPTLAGALKRAATSLEDEGVVAPGSIGAAEAAPVEEAGEAEEDLSDVIAALTIGSVDSETANVVEAPAEGTTEWPWANVGVVPIETEAVSDEIAIVPPADEDELLAEALEAAVSGDAAGDSLIVQSAAYGEDPFAPRAVIMGDYDETPISAQESAIVRDDEPEPTSQPLSAADEDETVREVADEAVSDLADQTLPEVSPLPGAYEISGDLELASYTCEDCVYSNTCPKVGQSTPDVCGAFQWKAV